MSAYARVLECHYTFTVWLFTLMCELMAWTLGMCEGMNAVVICMLTMAPFSWLFPRKFNQYKASWAPAQIVNVPSWRYLGLLTHATEHIL